MRPKYENKNDLANEEVVAEFMKQSGLVCQKLNPHVYKIDFGVFRDGALLMFAEIKARTHPHNEYRTYMISLHKWIKGVQLSYTVRKPFLIIVKFTDGIYYHSAKRSDKWLITMGGRTDRNDDLDREPCIFIPMSKFKKLEQK